MLALLRRQQRYGFDLVRELAAADGLLTSEGTIYPLLARLRRDGLVTTTWQESDAGPPRRYYALTPEGRTALTRFTSDWQRFRDSVDTLLGSGREQVDGEQVDSEQVEPVAEPDPATNSRGGSR